MKLKLYLILAVAVLLASGAGLSAAPDLHRAGGLLFEDPYTVPGLTVLTEIPGAPTVPNAVDLSGEMPPVGNQGQQGSCVAWAIGYYDKTHAEWVERRWNDSTPDHQVSPAFIYNQINGGRDAGAYMSDAQRFICEQGACMLSDMPYNQSDYTTWPSESAYARGTWYRGQNYAALNVTTDAGINSVKNLLAAGQTCVLGINVYSNFDYIRNYNYTYTVHDKYGTNRGGHAVCIVGYDDSKVTNDGNGAFKLVNSWGTGWGLAGYWWMSYYAVKTKSAGLSQGYAYITNDRTGYVPTALARVRLTHASRDRIGITFGIGRQKTPLWTKAFRQFQILSGTITNRAFPSNNLVFDLTDGASYLNQSDTVFVRCIDTKSDKLAGSINYLQASYNGRTGTSTQTVSIPDYNKAVYSKVRLSAMFGQQGEPLNASLAVNRADFRSGSVSIAFELAQPEVVRIAVYDGIGRTLVATTAPGKSGRNELTVNLPQFGGVCFYRLESGSGSITGKLAAVR